MQTSTTLLIVFLAAKQREDLPEEQNYEEEQKSATDTGESWQASALALPLCVSKMMVNCARRMTAVVGRQPTPAWTGATR